MFEEIIGAVTVFVTQAIFAPFIMLMLEYREPVCFWRGLWAGFIAVIVLLTLVLSYTLISAFTPNMERSLSSCRTYSPPSSARAITV